MVQHNATLHYILIICITSKSISNFNKYSRYRKESFWIKVNPHLKFLSKILFYTGTLKSQSYKFKSKCRRCCSTTKHKQSAVIAGHLVSIPEGKHQMIKTAPALIRLEESLTISPLEFNYFSKYMYCKVR
jgi:hypothetical protein